MKKTILFFAFALLSVAVFAQKKTTTSAIVSFDASTAIDDLPKAENKTVIAAVDTKTGTVQFEAAVKNFAFSNPSIQDHFNSERWLNSDAFPKFSFNGKISDLSKVNFAKDGNYSVEVSGNLTVRDVTKPVTTPASLEIKDGKITANTEFKIRLEDYNITGTSISSGKVSKEPKIKVFAELK